MQKIDIKVLSIELTHQCNLDCSWCFNKYSNNFSRKNFIKFEDLVHKLILFEKWRIKNNFKKPLIKLTGGEPLLYYRFKELIIFIKKYLKYSIKLNTNGLLLHHYSKDLIENNIDFILFSYHFLDKGMYNQKYVRQKNIASKVISNYSSNIYKIISTRINKDFMDNVQKFLFFSDKNFQFQKYIFWFPLLAKGEKLDFTKEDFDKFIDAVLSIKKILNLNLKIGFPPAFCFNNHPEKLNSITEIDNLYTFNGIRLNINPRGNITTSYYFSEEEIEGFGEKDLDSFLNSDFLKKMNSLDWLNDKCKQCKFLEKCGGGNRMFSYAVNGDFYSQDPWISEEYLGKI